MDIAVLAKKLSDDVISVTEVLLILQTIGATTGETNVVEALRLASDLNIHFREFSHFFPKLPVARFLNCKRLYANFSSCVCSSQIPVETDSCPVRTDIAEGFTSNRLGESDMTGKSKMFALGWLVYSFREWTPYHSRLRRVFENANQWEKIEIELLSDVFFAYGSPLDENWNVTKLDAIEWIVKWVEGFFSISAVLHPANPFDQNTGLLSAGYILSERKEPLQTGNAELTEHSTRRPRNWANLAERERLKVHHSAMPEQELLAFCKILRKAISEAKEGAIEALLTTLSILTCKTVDEVLSISINKTALESVRMETDGTGDNKRNFIVWSRTLHYKSFCKQQPPFSVVLPDFVEISLVGLFRKHQEGKIETCLPPSERPWGARTYAWLEEQVGFSKASLGRQLKHSLSREMYSQGAHSAVVNAFTFPVGIEGARVPRNPLSHYISYTSTHVHLAYVDAVSRLFGKYGSRNDSHLFQKLPHSTENEIDGSTLLDYYQKQIKHARVVKDKRGEHNWLARYTLLLLMAGTGHRRSRTPFFFRHDLLLDEKLGFVCEKNLAGSEARFVPLAEIVVDQLKEYLQHLALNLTYISSEVGGRKNLDKRKKANERSGANDAYPATGDVQIFSTGLFFTIDEKGRQKRISTKDIESTVLGIKLEIKAFRSQLLTWLAGQGISGFDIEALAGHNRHLHVFGHASTWSVASWADRLRPQLDRYLKESGWEVIKCDFPVANAPTILIHEPAIPSFALSDEAYEGRDGVARAASKRARSAITAILNREYLEARDWKLNSEAINDVEKQLALNLSGDPDALTKIRRELAAWKSRLSALVEMASIPSYNFIVGESGPVDVGFSRHYAIASQVKRKSSGRLGRTAPHISVEEKVWERISQIVFSLIAFDCVLSTGHVRLFIEAIVAGRTYRVADHLAVRVQAEDRPHRFEKSIILSPVTSAQIVALYQLPLAEIDKADMHKQIRTRLSAFVIRLIGRQPKPAWSVEDLVTIFKPLWFIRLPGALFFVATGQSRGAALDLPSEVALFHGLTPVLTPNPTETASSPPQHLSSDLSSNLKTVALQELKKLFNKDVLGHFETGEAARKKQNARLREALSKPPSSEPAELLRDCQIVNLLRTFASSMLDEGGLREHSLSVETIRDYLFTIAEELISVAWDVDLTAFDAEQFAELYEILKLRLIDKRHAGTVLPFFHRFLQRTNNAPYVSGIGLGLSVSVTTRASILTPDQYDKTANVLIANKTAQPWEVHSALQLLDLMYGYGLRSKEAHGLTARHVIGTTPHSVVVRYNKFRSVKSRSPRIVWAANLPKAARRRFGVVVEEARLHKHKDQPLFEDPKTDKTLYLTSRYSQLLTEALRTVTGNNSFVNYNLRHSFLTAGVSAVMPNVGFSGICKQYRDLILRDFNIRDMWSPIKGGSDGWPYGLELVAVMAGHESSMTTASSYWHLSHYDLHSYTSREFSLMNLSDRDIAAMLGVSPSAVSQSMSKEGSEAKWSKQHNAIYERVRRLKISSATESVCESEVTRKKKNIPAPQAKNTAASSTEMKLQWDRLNVLLSIRPELNLNLEAFKELLVTKHGFTVSGTDLLIKTYEELLKETGFDDFEPVSGGLTAVAPKFQRGVWRGLAKRRRFLTTAQHNLLSQANDMSLLQSLCSGWQEHVVVDRPFLIAKDPAQAVDYAQALTALGIEPTQILVHAVNYSETELRKFISLVHPKKITYGSTRVSKGYARMSTRELALNVEHRSGSGKLAGRDLHRAIFVMTIGLKLWTAKTG